MAEAQIGDEATLATLVVRAQKYKVIMDFFLDGCTFHLV